VTLELEIVDVKKERGDKKASYYIERLKHHYQPLYYVAPQFLPPCNENNRINKPNAMVLAPIQTKEN
jgi:hypothetical protein